MKQESNEEKVNRVGKKIGEIFFKNELTIKEIKELFEDFLSGINSEMDNLTPMELFKAKKPFKNHFKQIKD